MGGQGSGRKSVKAEAIYTLLGVQMNLQKLVHEGIDDPRVQRQDLKKMVSDSISEVKTAQEEIERL